MNYLETNIYLIENLKELSCQYRLYKIRGIPNSEDYHKNIQQLVDILSRRTKSPCALHSKGSQKYIAQPEGFDDLPNTVQLIRTTARIERVPGLQTLDFNSLNATEAKLAARFLQFSLQNPLFENPSLWQPRTGYPFYSKYPDKGFQKKNKHINLYRGFTFRIVILADGKIGICIDTRSKYVSRKSLPTKINFEEFNDKYKGLTCLYEFGDYWYEIRIEALNDLNVSETLMPDGETLFDLVHRKAGSKKSQLLLTLPKDSPVLVYYNSRGNPRNVPSGLCRLTFRTDHPDIRRFHSHTINPPFGKRREIEFITNKYFRNLSFGNIPILLSQTPLIIPSKRIKIPDLKFGNEKILSIHNKKGVLNVPLKVFPYKKKEQIYSREAGIFTRKPFDQQYFIMPRSIYETFGSLFIREIKNETQRICPKDEGMNYSPVIIPFNDSIQHSMYGFAKEILKVIAENNVERGFGIIMIPRLPSKLRSNEDELANFLMRELRKKEVYCSIIHTEVASESYELDDLDNGSKEWRLTSDRKQRSKFKGYIHHVVLNKILITNNIWPFVLASDLNADMTIGIDVKRNTVGFTSIYKNGENIRFFSSESEQREQISTKHMAAQIFRIIKEEMELLSIDIHNIVIHRQGRLFPSEEEGIKLALKKLKKNGIIKEDCGITLVELKTRSRIPFRLFKVLVPRGKQKEFTSNTKIGAYFPLSDKKAFVFTTGPPYKHKGTSVPLYINKIDGSLTLARIMEDIFSLSNLTWTKLDDCSRLPISVKMNDIRLREIAGEYDPDVLRFSEE